MKAEEDYQLAGQMSIFDLDIWSGKTSREPSAATKVKTSEPSLKKRPKSQTKMPLFLDLRRANGHQPDASWETDGLSLGEYMMPNIGEFLSGESAYVYSLISMGGAQDRYSLNCGEKPSREIPSKLSWILERNPDQKYNLSQKACQGILRRAEKRGKTLPLMLEQALRRQAGVLMDGMCNQNISSPKTELQNPYMLESAEEVAENPTSCNPSAFRSEQESQGGGKGILIQEEHTGALSTLNNQSVCVGVDAYNQSVSGDVAATLNATSGDSPTHSGPSVMVLNDQGGSQMAVSDDVSGTLRAEEHGHQPLVFEPGAASRVGGHVYEDDVAGTVRANAGDNQQAVVYGISSYDSNAMKSDNPHSGIYEAETARTLGLNGGSPACNQGGMAVVCLEGNGSRPSHQGDGWHEGDPMYTLNSTEHHAVAIENHPNDSRVKIREDGTVQTLSGRMGTGGGNVPMVMESKAVESHAQDARYNVGDVNQPLSANMEHDPANGGLVMEGTVFSDTAAARCAQDGRGGVHSQMMSDPEGNFVVESEPYTSSKASYHQHFTNDGKAETLVASDYKDPPTVTYGLDRASFNQGANAKYDFAVEEEKIATQVSRGPGAVLPWANSVVRRLTPKECERLQGFDDDWTNIGEWVDSKGKKHKDADSPRYKALGNSIALPFWAWLADRLAGQYRIYRPTMASLFDGIGGFPVSFGRAGFDPVWASEIEEFPIAVTKIHFPDVE